MTKPSAAPLPTAGAVARTAGDAEAERAPAATTAPPVGAPRAEPIDIHDTLAAALDASSPAAATGAGAAGDHHRPPAPAAPHRGRFITKARAEELEIKEFLAASEDLAARMRKLWSGSLRQRLRAVATDHAKSVEQRLAAGLELIKSAPDLPPLPPVDIEAMLDALIVAAQQNGIEPTIALRSDLRQVVQNKPPPAIAHARTLEVFKEHLEMQELRAEAKAMTRH